MITEERNQEILKALHQSVLDFNEEESVEWAKIALEEGVDPLTATIDGLTAGMLEAGDKYARQEYFVPELLLCSDALYAGLDVLKPAIKSSGKEVEKKGSIVIGVIEGDIHDIGKNLVKIMFDVAGWTVYDLGVDVPVDKFVEEQKRTGAEVVGISALMTTSMLAMPEAIQRLKAQDPNVIILLGGAPITQEVTAKYGADGTSKTAGTAVDEAVRLLKAR